MSPTVFRQFSYGFPSIINLNIDDNFLTANLSDGRVVSVPLAWFPKLLLAQKNILNNFEISPGGYGIHWPLIDEDISIKAFIS